MTQHWLDQSLKRWAHWYQVRMLDKSMGYPKTSPIANFGMPPSTGNVWDSASEQDWSDAEELHMLLKRLGYTADAVVTLKGVSRPVSFPVDLRVTGDRAHLTGAFVLNRADFGIGTSGPWNSLVGRQVTVRVALQARRA